MERSYKEYVIDHSSGFISVGINPDYVRKINSFVQDLVEAKASEEHHKVDSLSETKRFTTGFMGEAALERMLGIDIIDWNIGYSGLFHHPDVPGYRIGIKTVEYGKFPVIFKKNDYPQIICIKSNTHSNQIFVCGIATVDALNTYQDIDLIVDANLRARGTKTGFYGFEHLLPMRNISDLEPYKK